MIDPDFLSQVRRTTRELPRYLPSWMRATVHAVSRFGGARTVK